MSRESEDAVTDESEDVRLLRAEAQQRRDDALSWDGKAERLAGLTDAMYPGGSRMGPEARQEAARWRERAALLDRAADALALVEAARQAEPLATGVDPVRGADVWMAYVREAQPTERAATERDARRNLAARLVRTALDLVKP